MSKARGLHIGTSGWHYRHWVGPFYPLDCRSDSFLTHYAGFFGTTEINSTFYRLPAKERLAAWRDGTPASFVFACKASRYITHMKKLRDPFESTKLFFAAVEVLGKKLGPILFQLPPRWRANPLRLKAFLEALPKGHRYAFEFRDESWFRPSVFEILADHDAAFCLYDLAARQTPFQVTADFIYFRMHGPVSAYQGRYPTETLASWARRILSWRKAGLEVYGYFNNDSEGNAIKDARRLIGLIAKQDPEWMREGTIGENASKA